MTNSFPVNLPHQADGLDRGLAVSVHNDWELVQRLNTTGDLFDQSGKVDRIIGGLVYSSGLGGLTHLWNLVENLSDTIR